MANRNLVEDGLAVICRKKYFICYFISSHSSLQISELDVFYGVASKKIILKIIKPLNTLHIIYFA